MHTYKHTCSTHAYYSRFVGLHAVTEGVGRPAGKAERVSDAEYLEQFGIDTAPSFLRPDGGSMPLHGALHVGAT
jgi:hypothetical protein